MPELVDIFTLPVYGLASAEKERVLTSHIHSLTVHHASGCPAYRSVLHGMFPPGAEGYAPRVDQMPFLHVRLFKEHLLRSVPDEQIIKTITSSGTTGAAVSRISLDDVTSRSQIKALVYIMQEFLGRNRLPMLIIDHPSVIKDRRSFSARGAGILGLSNFGRDHTYALHDDMSLNFESIDSFLKRYSGQPILIFGFTFMIWQYFILPLEHAGCHYDFGQAVLFHSGGWKKLQDQAVSNQEFKSRLCGVAGIRRCHNFYGMAEQVGSVFMECEHGHLHTPVFADVIVRDPVTFLPLGFQNSGLIQVLSALPRSYPGHSILTEDIGVLLGEDDCPCGRMGRYFSVSGRLPKAESRGCSDTHQREIA